MRAAALLVLALGFGLTLLPGPWGDEQVSDLFVYRTYAGLFLDGTLPYRGIGFEYPPLAAPLLALPGLAGTGEAGYRLAFAALAFVLAASVVVLCGALAARTGGDRRRALLAAAAAPLLCGAMLRTHFDLAPVALILASLLALCAGRPRAGLAVLGLGVMTKLFPLVIAPVALGWLLARGRRRAAAEGAGALVAVLAAIALGAIVLSPEGAADAVGYHVERPPQIESTPAIALLGADALGFGRAEVVNSHRSDGVEHPAAGIATAASSALLVAVLALLAGAVASPGRGPPDERALVLAALVATVAFAALGKVLSPQYLIWAVPLAALAFAWRLHALAALSTTAIVLTLVEFPSYYFDVVAREPAALALVGVRDAVLVGVVAEGSRALLAMRGRPVPGSARSPSRGRRARPRPAPR